MYSDDRFIAKSSANLPPVDVAKGAAKGTLRRWMGTVVGAGVRQVQQQLSLGSYGESTETYKKRPRFWVRETMTSTTELTIALFPHIG